MGKKRRKMNIQPPPGPKGHDNPEARALDPEGKYPPYPFDPDYEPTDEDFEEALRATGAAPLPEDLTPEQVAAALFLPPLPSQKSQS